MPNPVDQLARSRRVITHSKERNQKVADGYPSITEGRNGDVSYRRIGNGIVMFVRDRDGWVNMTQSTGTTTDGQIAAITANNSAYYATGSGTSSDFTMSESVTSNDNSLLISGDNPMTGNSTINFEVETDPFKVIGNNIVDSGATSGITFDGSGNTAVDGTLKLSGDDILSSDGTSVITLSDTDASGNVDDVTIVSDLTVAGDLTVSGATATINVAILNIEDTAISIGAIPTGYSDATAAGGGLILKGTTDKTILWDNTDDAWKYNQGIFLTSTFGIQFHDNTSKIWASGAGTLEIEAAVGVLLTSPDMAGAGDTGKIGLDTGNAAAGDSGKITISTGTASGSAGNINISTDATMDVNATTLEMNGTTGTIDYATILNLDSAAEIEMATALLDIDATTLTMDGTTGTIDYTTKLTFGSSFQVETEMNTLYLDVNAVTLEMDGTTGTISYATILNLDSTTEIEMNTALLDVDATTLEMDGTTGTISYTTILNLDSTTEIEMVTALLDVDATTLTMDGTTGTITYTTLLQLDSTTETEMNTLLLDVNATTLEMDGTTGTILYTTKLNLDSTTETEMNTALLDVNSTSLTMDGTDAVITYPTIDLVASTDVDIDTPTIDLTTQWTDIDLIASTTKALTIDTDLMSFDSNQRRVGISTNAPYHEFEIYEGRLAFNLIDGEAGIIWNSDATDEMRLYRDAASGNQSDLKLDQHNGTSLFTDFTWSNVAIGSNTIAAKDSAIFTIRGKADEDEALIVFSAGAALTSYQWLLGYENELFVLYDGKNTQYALTVAPTTNDVTLVQDGQKMIFYDDDMYMASSTNDLHIRNGNYNGEIQIKAVSDPGAITTADAYMLIGPNGGLDNAARIYGHQVNLQTMLNTGYVSADNKFKACEKYFVSGSTSLDLLNYGTIEDGGGIVTQDLDFAETYATQTKAIIKEEMVQFKTDGLSADIYSGSSPMSYNLSYRAEYSCNLAGSAIQWQLDPNEGNQATLNGSDMLYNYSGLGYTTNIRQAPAELTICRNVSGPWNKGSYMHWHDGGLH